MYGNVCYQKSEANQREVLYADYVGLIKRYGTNGDLDTFTLCTDNNLSLNDSTIDKIQLCGDTILFFYNWNIGDYDMFMDFNVDDLAAFYDGLAHVLENNK